MVVKVIALDEEKKEHNVGSLRTECIKAFKAVKKDGKYAYTSIDLSTHQSFNVIETQDVILAGLQSFEGLDHVTRYEPFVNKEAE
jgi:hypothetical protein